MMTLLFLLLFGLVESREIRHRYLFNREILQEMDAWELKQLRDFVRKRGRGSVSREPFEEEMIQLVPPSGDEPELDLFDRGTVLQGGMAETPNINRPMLSPSSIIAAGSFGWMKSKQETTTRMSVRKESSQTHLKRRKPPNKSSNINSMESRSYANISSESNRDLTKEDFKSLVDLIQRIHSRRKSSAEEKSQMAEESQTTTERTPETATATLSKDEREAYVRQISQQISMILMMKKQKRPTHQQLPPRPRLTIIRNGSAEQTPDGRYEFVATVSLIQDNGKNILVDTGMGTDINGRTQLMNKLSSLGLTPPNIDIVVSTHGHPDHNGGVHDFPNAVHYQGWYQHYRTQFNLSGLFEGDRQVLTENVYLIRTPGHSSDDISIVIMEEESLGSVVIAGDTFLRKEDIDYQMMWKPLSANETEQTASRRRLACGSWRWIVPGHGPPFPLEPSLRAKFGC